MAKSKKANHSAQHSAVIKDIVEYLTYCGCLVWKNQTAMVSFPTKSGRPTFRRIGMIGSSDIIGVMPGGRFIAVEVKTGKGMLTEPQKAFQQRMVALGGFYVLAKCLDDVAQEVYPELFALKPPER